MYLIISYKIVMLPCRWR